MSRVRISAAVLLALVATMLAACGDDDDDDAAPTETSAASTTAAEATDDTEAESTDTTADDGTTTTAEAPAEDDACTEERVGGSLTMSGFTFTQGLDPSTNSGTGATGANELAALYDTLVRWNPDTGEFEPYVAESIEPNDDYSVWTVTLRPDITFGNGDPLTAEAVVASIQRPQSFFQGYLVSLVSSMRAVDPLTVEITLAEPWARFPYMLATEVGMIVNPAVAAERGEGFALDPTGAGVGPYEFVRYAAGEEVVLQAKDDYWGGPVCIEELRFVSVLGGAATYESFRNGDAQMAYLREAVPIADAVADGVQNYQSVVGLSGALFMNNREGRPTADPLVRRAVALAIDTDIINERAAGGQGLPTTRIIHESSPVGPTVPGLEHDAEEAARLVEEAKAAGWDGTIGLVCNNQPVFVETALAVEAMLEAVGMDVTYETGTVAEVTTRVLVDLNFDITCNASSFDAAGASVKVPRALSSTSQFNAMGFASPEMDAALADLRLAEDTDALREAMNGVQEVWNETTPAAMYSSAVECIVWDDAVHGLLFNRDTSVLWGDAWLEG